MGAFHRLIGKSCGRKNEARRGDNRGGKKRANVIRLAVEAMESRLMLSTTTVTNGADAGVGSLRGALLAASSGDTIDFAAAIREVDLTTAGLTLSKNVTIVNDQGTGPVTVNGGGQYTVFTVNSNVTASISGLTITDGNAGASVGGGVNNQGTLTLTNDTLSANTAEEGAGAFSNGTLTLNGCTVSGNHLAGSGQNFAAGIVNLGGTLTITNSTITNNTGEVGGIANVGGPIGSTTTTVIDSTITGNTGTTASGGIITVGDPEAVTIATVTLEDSIIAGNSGSSGNEIAVAPFATITDDGHNLLGDSSKSSAQAFIGFTPTSSDLVETSDKGNVAISAIVSSTLAGNGPTQTLSLPIGSPAIAAGVTADDPTTTTPITTDQRGFARPATKPDVGAYQYAGAYTLTVNDNADTLDNSASVLVNQLGSSITLRDAINAANNTGGQATIVLADTTYDFTTADNNWYGPNDLPPVYSDITIQGNGATLQRDSACAQTTAEAMRFFYVSGGIPTELPLGTLTLQNLTLTNGLAKGGDSTIGGGGMGAGGAIFNQGNLTLDGVTLTGNTAMGGSSGVHFNNVHGGVFGGGGIGQDGGGDVYASSGGGFGGNFPAGIYGGPGTAGGGGGFDTTAALAVVGGGFGGLGGNLNAQGFGGDGGTSSQGVGSGFGFGGVLNLNDPAGGVGYGGGGGGGGVGGGGGSGDAHGGGDGGFGGGGGSATFSYPAQESDGGESAGGFGGGGGGPNFSTFGTDGGGYGGFGAGHASAQGSGGGGGGMGGAVFSMFGSLTVINSTLTANTAQGGGSSTSSDGGPGTGGSGFGGAIFNLDGTASITFSTLVANTVTAGVGSSNGSADGGAIYNLAYGSNYDTGAAVTASATISDSILAGTTTGTVGASPNDLVNQEVDGGHAFGGLVQENTGNTASTLTTGLNIVVAASNIQGGPKGTATLGTTGFVAGVTNANLGLAPLGNYGGLTQTMALLPGSPAIGAGVSIAGITTDQRGDLRPSNPDLGAYQTTASVFTPIQIDAGGGTAGTFVADTDVTGGQTYSVSSAIDTSAIANPAQQPVYQTTRFGDFTYTIPNLSPGTSYSVTLGFDEPYFTSANQRLFNVSINGTSVLNNFDIFFTAGGIDKAIAQTFNAVADVNGKIAIQFSSLKNNATVSSIEVNNPVAPTAITGIDAGGPAVGSFASDKNFSGGTAFVVTHAIDTGALAKPAPQQVYQSQRYGNFAYTLQNLAPGSHHTVQLDFSENYWNSVGQRSFNVNINGVAALSNFDIFAAAGGEYRATTRSFDAVADGSGNIVVSFVTVKDNATVDAIELDPSTVTPPPPPPAPVPSAIDAGGPAVGLFAADKNFSGGTAYSVTHAIDTSAVGSGASQQVYQSQRYGNFTYTLPNLAPGSHHTVQLDFSENYWTAAGQRSFNVNINGVAALSNFDIFAAAGGAAYRAVTRSFDGVADGSGNIVVSFVSLKDNATVDAIEVDPSAATPPAPPAAATRIDSGGAAVGAFASDQDFVGGSTYSSSSPVDTSHVSNAPASSVFQTERYGNFSYVIPGLASGAAYTVRLDFAENYWQAAGQRLFNVAINGTQVLTNYDIFQAAGGSNIAIADTFTTNADANGKVTLVFTTVKDNAKIDGIELTPVGS